MAISSSTSTSAGTAFNVDGIVSGLKTADIINQLMTLSQAPLKQLTAQQTKIKARDDAYHTISSQLITFQGSAQNLLLSTSINTKLSASSAPTFATATADSTAINGNFSVNVIKLATATSVISGAVLGSPADLDPATIVSLAGLSVAPTAGSFTINGKTIAFDPAAPWSKLQSDILAVTTAAGTPVTLEMGVNGVSLRSAASVQLGSPSDTSNLLSATQLLGAAQTGSTADGYVVASKQLLGEARPTSSLSGAGLATTPTTSGTFAINGVNIAWTNTDSLSNVLSRINASAAGVTATYDPKVDKISLTNTNTGAQGISLVDGTGNLLAALNLQGATQVAGAAAQYTTTQNGVTSATQFSNSNTVTDAMQGVDVTLISIGTANITTTQDTATATKGIQAFITQFNSLVDSLDAATKVDTTGVATGVLVGDSSITALAAQLRSIVAQRAIVPAGSAYVTMGDIGISTGAYGSAIGSTNHLVLDTSKLTAALTNNPQGVTQLLAGLSGTSAVASDAPSTALLQSANGSPYGQVNSGTYKVTFDPSTLKLTSVFTSTSGTISPATTSTIAAGGTNTLLIPGMTIVAQNPLPGSATTAAIDYTVSGRGIFQTLNDYVNQTRGPNGVFVAESTNATSAEKDLTAQITHQNDLLTKRKATLQAQFTAMEVALASLQSQSSALSSSLSSLSNSQSSSSSSS